MKSYKPTDVRVVGLFGHRGSGKTSLVEAFLFNAGATPRMGSVDGHSQTLELDESAIERQVTMAANVGYAEWDGVRIGLVDSPGDGNFWGATNRALKIVDAGLVTVSATEGIEPVTSRVIADLGRRRVPFAVMLTKLDKDGVSFDAAVAELKGDFKKDLAVLAMPIGEGDAMRGVVSLLTRKAYFDDPSAAGAEVPAEMAAAVDSAYEALLDAVAAADDELAERYLEEGTLSEDELSRGLKSAFLKGDLVPVLVAAPPKNLGARVALDVIKALFPAPTERPAFKGYTSADATETVERIPSADGPLVAQVFRTFYDPFAGMLTYARVWSGKLVAGHDVFNSTRREGDRPSHCYLPQGGTKNGVEVKEVQAGDLVVLTKLKSTHTGDTLSSKDEPTFFPSFDEPEALLHFGLSAKVQKEEDKLGSLVHKFLEEDPSLRFERDPSSGETLLGGLGQAHIDHVVDRLKRAGIEVELHEPKVPYKESLRGVIRNVEGKHKKQTGGSGQYAVCFIHVEPQPRGAGFSFVDEVVGGAIPRQYIASVEKGARDYLKRGPLSGNEVVDVKVTVYDGKYHKVDSSDMAFQAAGRKAMKAALTDPKARMVLLEPYMELDITCPAESVGDVMGDLNSRRARVNDMTTEGRRGKINASVPMNEILRYTNVLRSITHGRGTFSMHFERYEEAPPNIKEQVMKDYVAAKDED